MKLLFAGTASGHPVVHRRCTSILVEHAGDAVLLDAGEGVTAALLAHGDIFDRLSSIWISHTHADHVSGLPLLLQGMHLARRSRPLELTVPPGREDWFRQWLDGMYMFEEKWSHPLRICPHAESAYAVPAHPEAFSIEARPNEHLRKVADLARKHNVRAEAFSFVLRTAEERVVFTSDVAGLKEIETMIEDTRLLVIDSAHADIEGIHVLAERDDALHIVCTHIPPEIEPRLAALQERSNNDFGGRILYAYDGMEYTIENNV